MPRTQPSANPLKYSPAEYLKALLALAVAIVGLVAFYLGLEPEFEEALVVTVEAAFGVVAVFLSTNYTAADIDKAVKALITGSVTLASFFTTVAPDTGELLLAIAAVLVQFLGVLLVENKGNTSPGGSDNLIPKPGAPGGAQVTGVTTQTT